MVGAGQWRRCGFAAHRCSTTPARCRPGVSNRAPLGTRVDGAGARGPADAAGLREALGQTQQDRRSRCGGDRRGGDGGRRCASCP
jgi:hypothetical protein